VHQIICCTCARNVVFLSLGRPAWQQLLSADVYGGGILAIIHRALRRNIWN
jgi:hypothetical protein